MSAGFGGAEYERAHSRAHELRERALELAEEDLTSYAVVLEALRVPRSDPQRKQRLAQANSDASEVPLQIAEVGAELTSLAALAAEQPNRHVEGDATAAALLAEGACRAAARLVELNLADAPGDGRVQRARELAREAASAREQALTRRSGNEN
jgi:formiminotetrahydrofolate cyclodeaminase